ncbi:MAG TPA: hypothetical protein VKP13_02040 [Nitrospira sp.]|nr:hypothetical protein [Nitrospira sp.]
MNNFFQTDADMIDLDDATGSIAEEEKPEQGLELHVGSNVFRTTNGVIKLQGKEQIVLEVQPDPPALLLTMDFYDEKGQRIGHLRRNTLSAAGSSRFVVSMNLAPDATLDDPLTVTVSDRTTGNTVIEVYLFQRRKIRVTSGYFHTHKGELVSISPHYCRIGTGLTMFGDVVESRGGTAVIG